MGRWREIKQNRIKNTETLISANNSSIISASPSSRFKAFLTDSFLITTPITYIIIYLVLGGGEEFAQDRIYGWSLIIGITAIIILFFWYVKFQTPGMKAYSIKIVNLENKRITLIQALIRYLATFFSIVSIFLMFMPFFNKEKKTFQDLVSKTIIINE